MPVSFDPLVYDYEFLQDGELAVDKDYIPSDPIQAIKFAGNLGIDVVVKMMCSGEISKSIFYAAAKAMEGRVIHVHEGTVSMITGNNKHILVVMSENVKSLQTADDVEEEDDVYVDDDDSVVSITGYGFTQLF